VTPHQHNDRVWRPEDFWEIEPKYRESYDERTNAGVQEAAKSKIAIVAIARNAMPYLKNTLALVDEMAARFRQAVMYVYENDSADNTAEALDEFATRQWVSVEHATLKRDDYRGFEPERTVRLAEYRNRCRDWVEENAQDADYVCVLDVDPHGGFSVDGVFNSIGWLREKRAGSPHPGGMASYSLLLREENGEVRLAQYDAWAARLNWWEDRRNPQWFHLLLPPAASPPILFNSAFGGLAVYTREAYLAGRYSGVGAEGTPDCEHVAFHYALSKAGYGLYLNPGSRYIALC
jgi:hypothetical protein